MIEIHENELAPVLHFARTIEVTPDYDYNGIIAYDSRILYVQSGSGRLSIDGSDYDLSPGTLLMWQAGSEYGFSEILLSPIKVMMFNFDFAGELGRTIKRIPSRRNDFDERKIENTPSFTENADANRVFALSEAFWAENIMREITGEYTSQKVYSGSVTRGMLTMLIAKLSRGMRVGEAGKAPIHDEIIAYINSHMTERLTYESLAKTFSYHPNHLSRIITQSTGMPLHRYLLRLRIEKACALLSDDGLSVSETAAICGFSDAASFAKRFRKETGLSPSELRRRK